MSEKEIPKECRFLKTCTRKVTEEHYEFVCDTESWIHCEFVKPQDYQEYLKIPNEWRVKTKK